MLPMVAPMAAGDPSAPLSVTSLPPGWSAGLRGLLANAAAGGTAMASLKEAAGVGGKHQQEDKKQLKQEEQQELELEQEQEQMQDEQQQQAAVSSPAKQEADSGARPQTRKRRRAAAAGVGELIKRENGSVVGEEDDIGDGEEAKEPAAAETLPAGAADAGTLPLSSPPKRVARKGDKAPLSSREARGGFLGALGGEAGAAGAAGDTAANMALAAAVLQQQLVLGGMPLAMMGELLGRAGPVWVRVALYEARDAAALREAAVELGPPPHLRAQPQAFSCQSLRHCRSPGLAACRKCRRGQRQRPTQPACRARPLPPAAARPAKGSGSPAWRRH